MNEFEFSAAPKSYSISDCYRGLKFYTPARIDTAASCCSACASTNMKSTTNFFDRMTSIRNSVIQQPFADLMNVFLHSNVPLILLISVLNSVNSKHCRTDRTSLITANSEQLLICHIMEKYQLKFGRPVSNMSESLAVKFGLQLIQIYDLDEKNQVLVTNVWQVYEWEDDQLVWKPDNYKGIKDIRLPVKEIWMPDVGLYNHADTRTEEKRDVMCKVFYNGTVIWRPMSMFKSTCQIDIRRFPYDEQICKMKFGSWTYDAQKVNLTFWKGMQQVDMSEYVQSNEWDIVNVSGIRTIKKYSCCPEEYLDLTFYIHLKRRGGFYNYILVLPCLLLSCLTMVLFWLPPESPAKMVLGMNIFTSFFVLLLLLYRNMPSSSKSIPMIGAYYCLNMGMIAMSTVLCAIVVHIHYRGNGRLPVVLKKIFLEWLSTILWIGTDNSQISTRATRTQPNTFNKKDSPQIRAEQNDMFAAGSECSDEGGDVCHNNDDSYCVGRYGTLDNDNDDIETNQMFQSEFINNSELKQLEDCVQQIRDYIRLKRRRSDQQLSVDQSRKDWIHLSIVLDRCFFVIYLLVMLITLILMFPH